MATNLSGPPGSNVSPLPSDNVADDVVILSERSVPILVRGIIADAQHLIGQQLSMFRQEIRDDVRKGKQVILILAVGVGITVGGSVLLLLMLPLLLNWVAPVLPLWTCFGIVGSVLTPAGGILLYLGVRKIESFDLLSNQAVEAFKESMTWKTKAT